MDKKYDVIGIGNALVDMLVHIDDAHLVANRIEKGIMKLVEEDESVRVRNLVCGPEAKIVPGGSVANTIAALASCGSSAAYIGKVHNDDLGRIYIDRMKKEGVDCHIKTATDGPATGLSIVMVSPDAQRTFNTYLGAAATLGPDDVDYSAIGNAKVAYLEGYMWDKASGGAAMEKIVEVSTKTGCKVALGLCDPFCVDRHRDIFLNLIKDGSVDLVLGNSDEIISLFKSGSFDDAINKCRQLKPVFAITKGAEGSVVISKKLFYKIDCVKPECLIDTTGAGDLYAAGFLHGFTRGQDLARCGLYGSIASSEIVSHFGARPEKNLCDLLSTACE